MNEEGRANQRLRTRQDLLRAAARLMKEGTTPTVAQVAEEALVSRATAYRYFPTRQSLLVEAPLDRDVPTAEDLFADDPSTDPEDRVDRAEAALHDMTYANEAQVRALLALSMERWAARETAEEKTPLRQNRRVRLIDAALAPVRSQLDDEIYENLRAALAAYFGIEPLVLFSDVLNVESDEARKIKSWAVRTLVRAALEQSRGSKGE